MINPDCLQGNDFLEKFVPLIEGMMNLGLTKKQAVKAACSQQFVKDFADTPEWFTSASKLPKDYKWGDGTKYNKKGCTKGDRKCVSEAYTFLTVGNDLYIKGFFSNWHYEYVGEEGNLHYMSAPKEVEDKICVIKDWKSIRPHEITYRLDATAFFDNSFWDFCHKNGVSLGLTVPTLKKWEDNAQCQNV